MKNKNFFQSVRKASVGLWSAIKRERNFKIYFLNVFVTLILNITFGFSVTQYILWFLTIAGVYSAECFNTVAEKICDKIIQEFDRDIRYIKDVAAGGVLCWGIAFYLVELISIIYNIVT